MGGGCLLRTPATTVGPLVILFLAGFLPATLAQSNRLSSRSDLEGLYSLRSSLGLRAHDWPRHTDPCSNWTGVTCRSGRVVELAISGLKRTRLGRLNPQFSVDGLQNLTRLARFNASGFYLPGPIPVWFGSLLAPNFSVLDLHGSGVRGAIPYSLGNLTRLTYLGLSTNDLKGPIPTSFGNLTRLGTLNLSYSNLSGSIPDSIWSLSQLSSLDLSGNNLTGVLPSLTPTFGSSNSSSTDLNLSDNSYYGVIPPGFNTLFSSLHSVDLSGNYFNGPEPTGTGSKNGNVSVSLNCFLNAPSQREPDKCRAFYSARGLPYNGPTSLPPYQQAPPSPVTKKSHKKLYILIGAIGGGILLILLLAALITVLWRCCMRRGAGRATERRRQEPGQAAAGPTPSVEHVITDVPGEGRPQISVVPAPQMRTRINYAAVGDSYTYDQLYNSTLAFSDSNLIRRGHSGDLYQGQLEDGTRIVVKHMGDRIERRDAYMAAELELFAKGMHERLVPLLGHCLDGQDEKFLVYRFVPCGDLASMLHRKPRKEGEEEEQEEGMRSLDWITRLKIATGVAEALCYLHHECTPPVVHRDIQASSVLLDDKFEVRLGSLSEACVQEGETNQNVVTRLLRFNPAPPDPSTSRSPNATCAYDVYCLGKVLLQLVTGQPTDPTATSADWLDRTLSSINIYDKELVTKIVDPTLIVDEDHLEEVWAMAIVAKSCLNPKPKLRPPMRHILKALENPLKVVREDLSSGSGRLRSTSSRWSWNAAFLGSWRRSSSDIGATGGPAARDELRRSETIRSGGSNGGERSFSLRRQYKEIFPEPSGVHDAGP